MRIIGLTLYIWLAFGARYAAAQDASRPQAPGSACIQFNQSVLDEVAIGRLEAAETALSKALASHANGLEPLCAGFLLHNMAVVMNVCERLTVFGHGKVIAAGTPREVAASPVVIEAYLGQATSEAEAAL